MFKTLTEYVKPQTARRETPVFWEVVLGDSILTSVTSDLQGIFVTRVQPDGPASSLLQPGDKILQVGVDLNQALSLNSVFASYTYNDMAFSTS